MKIAAVSVIHDHDEALELANRVVILHRGPLECARKPALD
jgi:ABC-type proline/glycine betaine transport system ATPase subunit